MFQPYPSELALDPAVPVPVEVTVRSDGGDFDSRKLGATQVFFSTLAGGKVKARPIR